MLIIIFSTWVYVQADCQPNENLNFLQSLTVKLEVARKFNEQSLIIKGQEVIQSSHFILHAVTDFSANLSFRSTSENAVASLLQGQAYLQWENN